MDVNSLRQSFLERGLGYMSEGDEDEEDEENEEVYKHKDEDDEENPEFLPEIKLDYIKPPMKGGNRRIVMKSKKIKKTRRIRKRGKKITGKKETKKKRTKKRRTKKRTRRRKTNRKR